MEGYVEIIEAAGPRYGIFVAAGILIAAVILAGIIKRRKR
jgi:hypothetical protein